MSSKRFKAKDCAYCRGKGISTTGDHVIAREFFFKQDRANLPQVPACLSCNSRKSKLETYATAALMAASRLEEGDRYRQEYVRPRLAKNRRLQHELGLHDEPVLMNINGVIWPMQVLKIEPRIIQDLMGLIAVGLYYHHTGKPLSPQVRPDASMFHPKHELKLLAGLDSLFPQGTRQFMNNFGGGSFVYAGAVSPMLDGLSVWRMFWHNGIRLHGENSPPQGVHMWWVITQSTDEALRVALPPVADTPSPSKRMPSAAPD